MKCRDEWTTAECIEHLNRIWSRKAREHGYEPQVQPEDVPTVLDRVEEQRKAA